MDANDTRQARVYPLLIRDLAEVLRRHGLTLNAWPQYGGADQYLGDAWEFAGEEIRIPLDATFERDLERAVQGHREKEG